MNHFITLSFVLWCVTRNKWTQFKMVPMLMGLVLLVAALFLFIYKTCTVLQYPYDHQHANTTYSDRDGTTLSLHSIYTLASTAILYAVRIERSLLCVILMMGIAFHSLAALSDNFTKQVSCIHFHFLVFISKNWVLMYQLVCGRDYRACKQTLPFLFESYILNLLCCCVGALDGVRISTSLYLDFGYPGIVYY